jgi:hypothetical protein
MFGVLVTLSGDFVVVAITEYTLPLVLLIKQLVRPDSQVEERKYESKRQTGT